MQSNLHRALKRQLCAMLLLLFANLSVHARQTITGKIIAGDDRQPVIGATVKVNGAAAVTTATMQLNRVYCLASPNCVLTWQKRLTVVGSKPMQKPGTGNAFSIGSGSGNSGVIPKRFKYPDSDRSSNTINWTAALKSQFGGTTDDINADMWLLK